MNKLYNWVTKRLVVLLTVVVMIYGSHKVQAQTGETINLGLYGGAAIDLTYCTTNSRLFAAVNTPGSVFYTDDSCQTWIRPFPTDSLEYHFAQRGWAGGARKIFANAKGWVAVQTAEQGGTLTAEVLSYAEGDSGTFFTAIDPYLLHQINPMYNANVTASALSDHYLFVGMQQFLIRLNDTIPLAESCIIARTDTISGIGSDYNILGLASPNDSSGYPLYLILGSGSTAEVYKLDTINGFTKLTVTGTPYQAEGVFTHPAQITGDTVFVTLKITATQTRKVYRSLDGGTTWTEITPGYGTQWPLHSADYSANWVASMPSSNGLRISFPGGGVSDDLGATWSVHVLPDNAMATLPTDPQFVAGAYGRGVATSSSGPAGVFTIQDNYGMSAVAISKIRHSGTVYYVATNAGLGYTTAYFDGSVAPFDKWNAPYGDFPVGTVGGDRGVSAVALSPTDPLHVVAGHMDGFSVTTTGPTGFSGVVPAGWNSSANYDQSVRDIQFVTDQIVVAVTGSGSNELLQPASPYGNIYRSTNGGANWSQVTPAGFYQGTSLVVGVANGDTVLFAGAGYWDDHYPKVDGALWRSDDQGATWTQVNNGPTGIAFGTTNMPIYDLDIDPRSNDTLYLASGQNLDYALVRSTDGGVTYTYASFPTEGAFNSVLVTASNPNIVHTGSRRNLYRWNTITSTVSISFHGLPGEFVPDLENGSVLLGTSTGLYKLNEEYGATSTNWNGVGNWSLGGNWSNGKPTYTMNAKVQTGSLTLDAGTGADVNALQIAPQAWFTLPSTSLLAVYDSVKIGSTAAGAGSFVDNTPDPTSFPGKVQSYLTKGRWHYVSPPVSGAKASALYFAGGTTSWMKIYKENIDDWEFIASLDYALTPGKGYAVWVDDAGLSETALYRGTLNKEDISVPLAFTDVAHGWNLLGNPFPCALDWDLGSWSQANTSGIVYVWDNGNYLSRNSIGSGSLTDGLIPMGQGFFVQAIGAAASITIPADARVHSNQGFYKDGDQTPYMLNMEVNNGSKRDQTTVGFYPSATPQVDHGLDAVRLAGAMDAPTLCTMASDKKLSINILPELSDSVDVPVWFSAPATGSFTASFTGVETFPDVNIFLIDKIASQTTPILPDATYSFSSDATDLTERFMLRFKHKGLGIGQTNGYAAPTVVVQNGQLTIHWKRIPDQKCQVRVFTLLGQQLGTWNLEPALHQSISIPSLNQQLILVTVQSNDQTFNVKAIVK